MRPEYPSAGQSDVVLDSSPPSGLHCWIRSEVRQWLEPHALILIAFFLFICLQPEPRFFISLSQVGVGILFVGLLTWENRPWEFLHVQPLQMRTLLRLRAVLVALLLLGLSLLLVIPLMAVFGMSDPHLALIDHLRGLLLGGGLFLVFVCSRAAGISVGAACVLCHFLNISWLWPLLVSTPWALFHLWPNHRLSQDVPQCPARPGDKPGFNWDRPSLLTLARGLFQEKEAQWMAVKVGAISGLMPYLGIIIVTYLILGLMDGRGTEGFLYISVVALGAYMPTFLPIEMTALKHRTDFAYLFPLRRATMLRLELTSWCVYLAFLHLGLALISSAVDLFILHPGGPDRSHSSVQMVISLLAWTVPTIFIRAFENPIAASSNEPISLSYLKVRHLWAATAVCAIVLTPVAITFGIIGVLIASAPFVIFPFVFANWIEGLVEPVEGLPPRSGGESAGLREAPQQEVNS